MSAASRTENVIGPRSKEEITFDDLAKYTGSHCVVSDIILMVVV